MEKNKKRFSYENILLLLFYPFAIIPKQIFFVISFLTIGLLLIIKQSWKKTRLFTLILTLFGIHIFSTIIFFFAKNVALTRVIAAFNTALSWIISGIMLGFSPKNIKSNTFNNRKIAFLNIVLLVGLSVFALICQRINRNYSLFGNSLYINDWVTSGQETRLLLFFDYSSLITFFVIFNLGFYLQNKRCKRDLFVILICILPVYYSKSRICLLGYLVLLGLYLLAFIKDNFRNYKIFYFVITLIVLCFLVICRGKIIEFLYDFIHMRENSNNARWEVYMQSISFALRNSPLFGVGVKLEYSLNVPYGSHSTFIGLFYKLGFVGLLVGFILYFSILKISVRSADKNFLYIFLALTIIMFFEDIDGTNWLVFYAFVLLNMFLQKEKKIN